MCHGFGLLLGIIGVAAFLKVASCAFRRRWYAYGGHGGYGSCGEGGGGCGSRARGGWGGRWGGGWGHHGRGRGEDREYGEGERVGGERDGFGFGKRFFLRFIFERLDTTPGQEKVLAQAFDEIREAVKTAKGDWTSSRSRMADAMRGAEFDHEAVGEAWAKHDTAFEAMRLKVATSMAQVHEALDERQRKILADLIEKGGPFGRWGHE
jgi:uncharacterized membrane protein